METKKESDEKNSPKKESKWKKAKYFSFVQNVFYQNSFRDQGRHDIEENKINEKGRAELETNPPSWFKQMFCVLFNICTSHFGLFTLNVIYMIIGAGIFHAIESKQQGLSNAEIISTIRNGTLNSMMQNINKFTNVSNSSSSQLEDSMLTLMKQFEQQLTANKILVGSVNAKEKWDFWGAMLFCMTVCSTIGYGHIAPVTTAGRWVTIVYGMFGIPLCLTMLADIGVVITKIIKYAYKKLRLHCKCICFKNKTNPQHYTAAAEETYPKSAKKKQNITANVTHFQNIAKEILIQRNDEIKEEQDPKVSVLVPIAITLIYALLGSAMYMLWENWTFTESFYFIFISLSTIGFGDVYPEHRNYFLISGIYLIFGLSLLAMILGFIVDATNDTLSKAKLKADEIAQQKLGLNETAEKSSVSVFKDKLDNQQIRQKKSETSYTSNTKGRKVELNKKT